MKTWRVPVVLTIEAESAGDAADVADALLQKIDGDEVEEEEEYQSGGSMSGYEVGFAGKAEAI